MQPRDRLLLVSRILGRQAENVARARRAKLRMVIAKCT